MHFFKCITLALRGAAHLIVMGESNCPSIPWYSVFSSGYCICFFSVFLDCWLFGTGIFVEKRYINIFIITIHELWNYSFRSILAENKKYLSELGLSDIREATWPKHSRSFQSCLKNLFWDCCRWFIGKISPAHNLKERKLTKYTVSISAWSFLFKRKDQAERDTAYLLLYFKLWAGEIFPIFIADEKFFSLLCYFR